MLKLQWEIRRGAGLGGRRVACCAALAAAVTLLGSAAAHASATNAYIANDLTFGSTVLQYGITSTGGLAPRSPASAPADPNANGVVVAPDGKHAYVTSYGGNDVNQYDIGATGLLSPKTPAHVPAGSGPADIAVSPNGKSLYVVNAGGTSISEYDVGTSGLLTPKTPATVPTGGGPAEIAVSPDDTSVYVADYADSAISQYTVGAGGVLSAKTPATVPAGAGPEGLAISPDGANVYVTNRTDNNVGTYRVGANGLLSLVATVVAGTAPIAVTVSPDGHSAYAVNFTSGSVSQYDRGSSGVLSPKTPATVGTGSHPGGIAARPDGKSMYVTNNVTADVSQYNVGSGGLLSPKTPATVPAGTGPSGLAIAPDQGPAASLTANASPAGSASRFDGSASRDADGSVARYDWTFGDGTTVLNGGARPTHSYPKPGTYTATLTVTDDAGCSTALVFTGQEVLCNGSAAARTTRSIVVPKANPKPPPHPSLTAFKIAPKAFFAAPSGPSVARVRYGTTVSYRDSAAAVTTLTVRQSLAGVKRGKRCTAPPKRPGSHKLKRCTRTITIGTFTHHDRAGANRIHFTGRVHGHTLKPGRYTLRAIAELNRLVSKPVQASFRVKSRTRR